MLQGNKKWYKSNGVWGGIMAALSGVAMMFGYDLGSPELWAGAITSLIGGVLAFYGRIKAVDKIEK